MQVYRPKILAFFFVALILGFLTHCGVKQAPKPAKFEVGPFETILSPEGQPKR